MGNNEKMKKPQDLRDFLEGTTEKISCVVNEYVNAARVQFPRFCHLRRVDIFRRCDI